MPRYGRDSQTLQNIVPTIIIVRVGLGYSVAGAEPLAKRRDYRVFTI
jgi:hypothetical protein